MKPTEVLKHEHDIVLVVLDATAKQLNSIQKTGEIEEEKLNFILDFLKNFVDRCHHSKEEKHLFPKMVERGIAGDAGPIAILLEEHEEGRRLVRTIAEALEKSAATTHPEAIVTVKENLQAYIAMLRKHVLRENEVLYPMADQLFTAWDEEELIQAFDQVEADEMGEGTHEKYHQMAHDLMHG